MSRMIRRQQLVVMLIIIASCIIGTAFVLPFRNSAHGTRAPDSVGSRQSQQRTFLAQDVGEGEGILHGAASAPKLENATLKAELGHASWKLFHTMMAKFPDKPTADDQAALKSYIYLFARLYPCGDCARHFQELLGRFPPQVATRSTAAAWACHVHNEVNKRLKKEIFDCSNIGDFYDCGCADDDEKEKGKGEGEGEGVKLKRKKEKRQVAGGPVS